MIITTPDTPTALSYLVKHIDDSRLIEYFGSDILIEKCDSITVITASPVPQHTEYDSSFGGLAKPCGIWLNQKVISYLRSLPNALVLFEDPISLPSDTYVLTQDHPPYWHYKERMFWPVLSTRADYQNVEQSRAWVAGFREIALFTEAPPGLTSVADTCALSPEDFGIIASSLRSIVTDIFDGEGFMEWYRRAS